MSRRERNQSWGTSLVLTASHPYDASDSSTNMFFSLCWFCVQMKQTRTQCGMRRFNHLHLLQLTRQRDKVLLLWSHSVNYHIMEFSFVSAFMSGDELLLFFSSLASWDSMTGPVWWLAAFLLSRSDRSVMSDQSKHQGWQDVEMTARSVFQRGLDVQKPKDLLTSQLTRTLWSSSVFLPSSTQSVHVVSTVIGS